MKYVQFRKLNGPFRWFHFINFIEIECPEAKMKEIQENWTSPKLPPFYANNAATLSVSNHTHRGRN